MKCAKKYISAGVILTLSLALSLPARSNDKLKLVTTIPDLADIAARIGGDRVEVEALAKGYQDPHFVDAKPSLILKLKRADMFIQVGLDLEIGWVPPLLEAARNKNIFYGGTGYVNASEGIELLEVPNVDAAQLRAQGDIHVWGNPHFWLDPMNGKIIAGNISAKLSKISPSDASYFQNNLATFTAQLDSANAVWMQKIAPFKNTEILAYHNSWPYFEEHFQLRIAGFIEAKPGIPPTPGHLVDLIQIIKNKKIGVIIISTYFDDKPAKSVASQVGAKVIPVAPSVGAFKEVKSYFDLFSYNIDVLVKAFEETEVAPIH